MSLLSRTVTAVGWTTGARIAQQAFQFGLSVVLMRLLGPGTFGLIGMVLVFSGFAAIFSELGFSAALVQRQDLREEHRSSAFWLNLGMACVLALGLYLAAPLVAGFYHQPQLRPLAACLALNFLFSTPGMVPRALLQKALQFDVLAKVDVASLVVSGLTAASVAALGGGIWSLAAQLLVGSATTSALLLGLGGWRPSLTWSRRALRELLGYGAGLTGFNVINYWARSADTMLIGRFIGSEALGLYSRAYSLMLLPLSQIVSVLAPVMLPALSSIQGDKPRVRRSYLRAMRLLTFITFPMMLGLAVVADPFVKALFGPRWAGAVPLIQILSVVGMTQTLCNPVGWIYTSQGRTDWMFWWGLGGAGFLVLCIVAGIILGSTQAVALCYLVGNLIITVPCIAIPGRLIEMSVLEVWQAVRSNLFCGLGMAVVVWCAGCSLPSSALPLVRLLLQVAIGVAAYGALAFLSRLEGLRELLELGDRFVPRWARMARPAAAIQVE